MQNQWIIDVFKDLKTFAANNGLTVLAGQLEDTSLVAIEELSSQAGAIGTAENWGTGSTGRIHRTVATR